MNVRPLSLLRRKGIQWTGFYPKDMIRSYYIHAVYGNYTRHEIAFVFYYFPFYVIFLGKFSFIARSRITNLNFTQNRCVKILFLFVTRAQCKIQHWDRNTSCQSGDRHSPHLGRNVTLSSGDRETLSLFSMSR